MVNDEHAARRELVRTEKRIPRPIDQGTPGAEAKLKDAQGRLEWARLKVDEA